ncbi:hypothetical protein MMC10_007237 [Thelotrema lepadinum]|nr:hypothetical protein [Thelotrema lepadinum]
MFSNANPVYLNLPGGFITFVTLVLFFHPPRNNAGKSSLVQRISSLDWLGNLLIIGATVMLLLALQWGGIDFTWNSPRIIGLLVGSGLSFVLFIAWQWHRGARALLPLSLISQRTVAASFLMSFFLSGTIFIHNYFLPFWFQVIQGNTPIQSGVHVIPYVASSFLASLIAGIAVTKTGYFTPPAILGPFIAIGGSVALAQLQVDTPTATWIGFEILASFGIGLANQQGIVATQAVIPDSAAAIGSATIIFGQSLAGAIFVSVGDNVLRNELFTTLTDAHLSGVDVQGILNAGVTNVAGFIPRTELPTVLALYNSVLDKVFIISVPLAALAFLSALGMEWRKIGQK